MEKMTIKLDLEYGCEPIWLLDEDGLTIDTTLPDELKGDKDLMELMHEITQEYDGQWINNSKEFTFVGFKTPEDKAKFKSDLIRFATEIKARLKGKYEIIDAFHYEYY